MSSYLMPTRLSEEEDVQMVAKYYYISECASIFYRGEQAVAFDPAQFRAESDRIEKDVLAKVPDELRRCPDINDRAAVDTFFSGLFAFLDGPVTSLETAIPQMIIPTMITQAIKHIYLEGDDLYGKPIFPRASKLHMEWLIAEGRVPQSIAERTEPPALRIEDMDDLGVDLGDEITFSKSIDGKMSWHICEVMDVIVSRASGNVLFDVQIDGVEQRLVREDMLDMVLKNKTSM